MQNKYSLTPDLDIIKHCLDGEIDAWNALINRYKTLIYRVARKMGLSADDASDVLQDVSILLVNHLEDLRDQDRLSHWLIITTKREVWRLCRRRDRQTEKSVSSISLTEELTEEIFESIQDTSPSPDSAYLALVDQSLVQQALQELDSPCKMILTHLYCNDPPGSHADAAKLLNIPLGSVSAKRDGCLKKMKKNLDKIGF